MPYFLIYLKNSCVASTETCSNRFITTETKGLIETKACLNHARIQQQHKICAEQSRMIAPSLLLSKLSW